MTPPIVCAHCDGQGWLACPCDTDHDCSCALWECPDCEGVGGIDEQMEAVR